MSPCQCAGATAFNSATAVPPASASKSRMGRRRWPLVKRRHLHLGTRDLQGSSFQPEDQRSRIGSLCRRVRGGAVGARTPCGKRNLLALVSGCWILAWREAHLFSTRLDVVPLHSPPGSWYAGASTRCAGRGCQRRIKGTLRMTLAPAPKRSVVPTSAQPRCPMKARCQRAAVPCGLTGMSNRPRHTTMRCRPCEKQGVWAEKYVPSVVPWTDST